MILAENERRVLVLPLYSKYRASDYYFNYAYIYFFLMLC